MMLGLLFIRPVIQRTLGLIGKIKEEENVNSRHIARLNELVEISKEYNSLYAQYQKYLTELPSGSNVQVLTNEFYNISQYTNTEIQSINFEEVIEKDSNIGIIQTNLVIQGSYYDILVFVKTVEIMPRSMRIIGIEISQAGEDYSNLIGVIEAESYFQRTN